MKKQVEFNHKNENYNILLNFLRSPSDQGSLVKNVPIDLLETVKTAIREIFPDKKIHVKYRGPRFSAGSKSSGYCLKRNATSAAIYFTDYDTNFEKVKRWN